MVIFNLRTNEITDNPKYHLTQNWDNVNLMDVGLLASFNPLLQEIWAIRDVHDTWKLLSDGIEDMSNMLAPTKAVKHRSNFQPYINDKICDLGEQVKLNSTMLLALVMILIGMIITNAIVFIKRHETLIKINISQLCLLVLRKYGSISKQ